MDIHEEIKKVAYELYEKCGRIGGREIENWLAAEKMVMARHAQNERGIKAVTRTPKKAAVAAKAQKTKIQDAGSRDISTGKPGAKKTAPKKTIKTAK
jgi:hypothetical protein